MVSMKRILSFLAGALFIASPAGIEAEGRSASPLSGSFLSAFDVQNERLFPDGKGSVSQGWTNWAALRFRSAGSENLSFFLSVTIDTASGIYARENAADVKLGLERLYFKAGNEWLDVETGLIRIARGYGYLFSPLDLFNPRDVADSIDPQARPPGKWGVHATFYPQEMWKVELFGLASDNPRERGVWGSRFGAATTFSLGKTSFDLLYALFLPEIEQGLDPASLSLPPYTNNDFSQVAGFAVKTDVEIGLFVEAVYRLDHRLLRQAAAGDEHFTGYDGLQAALGVDYTFAGADLYLLGEYLFYGGGHVDWACAGLDSLYTSPDWKTLAPAQRLVFFDATKRPLPFARHDYLFLLARLTPRQDFVLGASALCGLDDLSALCTLFTEYEVIQGLTLELSLLVPLDRTSFGLSAEPGEWGSTSLGFYQLLRVATKVKF